MARLWMATEALLELADICIVTGKGLGDNPRSGVDVLELTQLKLLGCHPVQFLRISAPCFVRHLVKAVDCRHRQIPRGYNRRLHIHRSGGRSPK